MSQYMLMINLEWPCMCTLLSKGSDRTDSNLTKPVEGLQDSLKAEISAVQNKSSRLGT